MDGGGGRGGEEEVETIRRRKRRGEQEEEQEEVLGYQRPINITGLEEIRAKPYNRGFCPFFLFSFFLPRGF